jgi:ectoine hydroxylase-related dioxygenase (phytanoyl-CoA dioxygenase family)
VTNNAADAKGVFDNHGYFVVRRLLAPDDTRSLLRGYLQAVAGNVFVPTWREYARAVQEGRTPTQREHRGAHLFTQLARPSDSAALGHWRSHIGYQRAGELARSLAPDDQLEFSYDQCFYKPGGCDAVVYPHQDAAYWKTLGLTCWIALTAVTRSMAPVEYYPGTHTQLLPHVPAPKAWNGIRDLTVAPEALATLTAPVTFELEPGDCVFHSSLTVHGSGGNRGSSPRCGLALHFKGARPRDLARRENGSHPHSI